MMNLFNTVRFNAAVESAPIQATGGQTDNVQPKGPTEEDGKRLAMIHVSRADAIFSAACKDFREGLAPSSVIRDKARVERMKVELADAFQTWMDETVGDREAVDAFPNGTTIKGFNMPGIRCTTAVIANRWGPIGTNEDAVVTRKSVKDELKRVTTGLRAAIKAVTK